MQRYLKKCKNIVYHNVYKYIMMIHQKIRLYKLLEHIYTLSECMDSALQINRQPLSYHLYCMDKGCLLCNV